MKDTPFHSTVSKFRGIQANFISAKLFCIVYCRFAKSASPSKNWMCCSAYSMLLRGCLVMSVFSPSPTFLAIFAMWLSLSPLVQRALMTGIFF